MEYDPATPGRLTSAQLFGELLARRVGLGARETNTPFSFGIEEEYFLHDAAAGDLARETPSALFDAAKAATEGLVDREFLQCQVEVATPPFSTLAEARTELTYVRAVLARLADLHGLSLLACGTHPTARWRSTVQSEKTRYDQIMGDLQMIGRRNLVCGMHVHVSLPDPDRRVEVMRRLIPYLPLFLALSASSPFWQAQPTGLKAYRLAAYDELPRSGVPEAFASKEEYDRYVAAMTKSGAIADASHLWWMVRPSLRFPTLELRAPDCCTRLDDALAIAALFRALVRHLYFLPPDSDPPGAVERAFAVENKWRAQRYGVGSTFVTADGPVTASDFLERTIAQTAEHARQLDCEADIARCREIVQNGTSADRQLEVYTALDGTRGAKAALAGVVEWIAATTRA
jgi:carboxylate-amine ligase